MGEGTCGVLLAEFELDWYMLSLLQAKNTKNMQFDNFEFWELLYLPIG